MKEELSLKTLLQQALKYWYLFAILFPVSVAAAYYYLEHAQPEYEANALILLKQGEFSGQLSESEIFADLKLGNKNMNLKNELRILGSMPLLTEVVQNLGLEDYYTRLDGIRRVDLYQSSPIEVISWEPKVEGAGLFAVFNHLDNGQYQITTELEEKEYDYQGEFGKMLELPFGKLIITTTGNPGLSYPIEIEVVPAGVAAGSISQRLMVSPVDAESSLLTLGVTDVSPVRARDILQELIEVYNDNSIKEENGVYQNTIDLINERIRLIASELSEVEMEEEAYKRQFSSMQLSAEGRILMNEVINYNKQLNSQRVQFEILESIERFLIENRERFEFVPTNVEINNLTLVNQLNSFNKLLADHEQLKSDLGPSHPDLKLTQKQIQNLRETIIENIQTIKADLQINLASSQQQKNDMETRLRILPTRERELIEIERQKKIKEDLYVYLLQKREEAAISLAATVAKGKVVNPAQVPSQPISPKRMQIWLIAFFLGLGIPAGLAILIDSLNDRVRAGDDLSRFTSVPVIGAIGLSKADKQLVINKDTRSPVAEMFRLLRVNLAGIRPQNPPQVFMMTSSVSKEGKSFLTLNLAMTHALARKRAVILELDLRRPRQEVYSKLERAKKGVSDYLENESVKLSSIIRNSGLHPDLDLISSGPIPSNPSELILSPRLRELVDALKVRYDLVFIDAPPVGMVADALQLKDVADVTLYAVRVGFTETAQLQIIEDITRKNKLPNPFIIINALPMKKSSGYSYSYGYGSDGIGSNGYYGDKKPRALAKLNTIFLSKFLP